MEFGVFEFLDELEFLDERPKFNKTTQGNLKLNRNFFYNFFLIKETWCIFVDSDDNSEFKRYHELLIIILRLIACILTSIGHDSGPALVKVRLFMMNYVYINVLIFFFNV